MDGVVATSQQSIAEGSKSFSAAARLFGRQTRESASMLYAWCRHCDDVIDDQVLGFSAPARSEASPEARLEGLYQQTRAAIAGNPGGDPVFQALHRVVERHAIPERYPLELIDGFGMDVAGRSYETLDEVLDYCYHVAGVVGVMMAMVMGARAPATLVRAADLGIAFQLTNISRDVVEDAANGRVYLPGRWLDDAGVPRSDVTAPEHRAAVADVVRDLLEQAEPYYRSARVGLRDLPFRAGWAIAAARGVYRDIGRGVERRGASAWDRRVSTGRMRKLYWMVAGGLTAASASTVEHLLPMPARPNMWMKPGVGV